MPPTRIVKINHAVAMNLALAVARYCQPAVPPPGHPRAPPSCCAPRPAAEGPPAHRPRRSHRFEPERHAYRRVVHDVWGTAARSGPPGRRPRTGPPHLHDTLGPKALQPPPVAADLPEN